MPLRAKPRCSGLLRIQPLATCAMVMLLPLEANWNRPLLALLMICITVIACTALWALTKIRK